MTFIDVASFRDRSSADPGVTLSRQHKWQWINGALLVVVAVAILGVEAWDRPSAAVEAGVRRYAEAVSNSDLEGAMAEIAPAERPRWRDWVNGQLGNIYDVTGVAVRSTWLLGRPTEVTTDLDVNRAYPDQYYQASPRVALQQDGTRYYLAAPLLASEP
jgi:hypothetical protein